MRSSAIFMMIADTRPAILFIKVGAPQTTIDLIDCKDNSGFANFKSVFFRKNGVNAIIVQMNIDALVARAEPTMFIFRTRINTDKSPIVRNDMKILINILKSLSHSKWRCKYHIAFAPKYRRQEICGKIKSDIGTILRKLCEQKGVEIIEAQACPDHIHMMGSIPPSLSVAQFVGYFKGKSSLMIFDRHANLKYKYGNRHFWCRGYM